VFSHQRQTAHLFGLRLQQCVLARHRSGRGFGHRHPQQDDQRQHQPGGGQHQARGGTRMGLLGDARLAGQLHRRVEKRPGQGADLGGRLLEARQVEGPQAAQVIGHAREELLTLARPLARSDLHRPRLAGVFRTR